MLKVDNPFALKYHKLQSYAQKLCNVVIAFSINKFNSNEGSRNSFCERNAESVCLCVSLCTSAFSLAFACMSLVCVTVVCIQVAM